MSPAALVGFAVHQVVLVGLVLATHHVQWPPEIEYAAVCLRGVVGTFVVGSLLVRLPGASRLV